MYKKAIALGAAALFAASVLAGCSSMSTSTGGTDNQQHSNGGSSSDCGYSWNPCGKASAPNGGGDSSPKASKQPLPQDTYAFRWGDYKFGSCTLELFPGYVGLTISDAHVVVVAGTGCVGFRPQNVSIKMTVERWYSEGGAPRAWHDAGLLVIYDSDIDGGPNLVIPSPDGSVPLSHLTQLKDAIPCKRDIQQGFSLYRLNIVITGISYGGTPFGPLGGQGSVITSHNSECNS